MQPKTEREPEQSATADFYETLQVSSKAEPEVIEAAYKRLALKYHPDLNPTPEATRRMQGLNAAYVVLSDPVRRAEYDHANFPARPSRRTRYVRPRRTRPGPRSEAPAATPPTSEEDAPPSGSSYNWEEFELNQEESAREWAYVSGYRLKNLGLGLVIIAVVGLILTGLLLFGNISTSDRETGLGSTSLKPLLPPNVIFDDDFDTVSGANWILEAPWHLTTKLAASSTHSLWVGEDGKKGYQANLNATATLARPVELSGTQNPLLRFRLSGQFDNELQATGRDRLWVEVAESGRDFEAAFNTSGAFSNWQDMLVDLSKWKSKIVIIRFRFSSGSPVFPNYSGPFIDDVRIER